MTVLATAPRSLRRAIAADKARHDARRQSRAARRLAQRNAEVRAGHRRLRTGLWHYLSRAELATLLTAPVIYSVALPFVVLDAWVWIYQAACFRAWGIRPVRRRAYFAIDRHKLAYLNAFEKFNCLFCSYANGVIAYVGEVAARTEQYWCPIRHARRTRRPHSHYDAFVDYGDASAYRRQLKRLRAALEE
jgi:hypothetical protein